VFVSVGRVKHVLLAACDLTQRVGLKSEDRTKHPSL
jgi:hypothetical protein